MPLSFHNCPALLGSLVGRLDIITVPLLFTTTVPSKSGSVIVLSADGPVPAVNVVSNASAVPPSNLISKPVLRNKPFSFILAVTVLEPFFLIQNSSKPSSAVFVVSPILPLICA